MANQFDQFKSLGASVPTDPMKKVYAKNRLKDHPKYDSVLKKAFYRAMDIHYPLTWTEIEKLIREQLLEDEEDEAAR